MQQEATKQETKKKSGLRKAMLPALAMLLASVLSLTTMTYAWFTTGNTAKVSEFDMTIAAGGGLEISADGKAWSSTLDSTTITALSAYTSGTKKLEPVSTDGGFDFSSGDIESADSVKLNFFKGEVESGDAGAKLTKSTTATEGWVQFPLYFRNNGESDLNVTLGTTKIEAKTGADFGHLAVRMAFVKYGSCAAHAADVQIAKDGTTTGTANIFEPNEKEHTQAGIADYKTKFAEAEDNVKFTYYALKQEYSSTPLDRYADNEIFTKMDGADSGTHTYGASEQYFTLAHGQITQIVVFMWIEGQDPDCTNTIASNLFKTTLQFTVAAE